MGERVPAGYAEATFNLIVAGDEERMLTSIGIQMEPGVSITPGLAAFLSTTYENSLLALSGAGYTFRGTELKAGPEGQGLQLFDDRTTVSPNAGSPVPPNTAILVQKKSQFGGRRNRGRMYLPGPAESVVSAAGFIATADLAAMQSELDGFMASALGHADVAELVIFHQTLDVEPTITPTVISDLVVANRVATQRRRLRP